jgi:hypothetical protein
VLQVLQVLQALQALQGLRVLQALRVFPWWHLARKQLLPFHSSATQILALTTTGQTN